VTPFVAVLIGGFLFVLVYLDLMLFGPRVFDPALLVALAVLSVVPLSRRPREQRK
jgi:hypothetical protein